MTRTFLKITNVLVFRGLGSGASILFAVLVARHLNPNDAGLIFLLTNIVIMLSVCIRWGLDQVIIRRVAVAAGETQRVICGDMLRLGHGRVIRFGLGVLASVPIIYLLDNYLKVYGLSPANWLFIIVTSFALALVACFGRVLQGLGEINLSIFVMNILVPSTACIWIVGCIMIAGGVSAYSILLEYSLTAVLAYLALLIWAKKQFRGVIFRTVSPSDALGKKDLRAADRLGTVVLAQQSLIWGSALLVPMLFDNGTYSVFIVSQKIAMVISFVMLAVNFTFSSRMALLFNRKEHIHLTRLLVTAGSVVGIAATSVAGIVLFFRTEIIAYTNVTHAEAGTLLAILVISQVFNSMSAFLSVVLSMAHQEEFLMKVQLSGNLIGFALFTMLALSFGITIASCAFVATYLGLALVLLCRVYQVVRQLNAKGEVSPIDPYRSELLDVT
jgi:O-antigen/teichoic acid export membrane protein